jgi:hypothetical protein
MKTRTRKARRRTLNQTYQTNNFPKLDRSQPVMNGDAKQNLKAILGILDDCISECIGITTSVVQGLSQRSKKEIVDLGTQAARAHRFVNADLEAERSSDE